MIESHEDSVLRHALAAGGDGFSPAPLGATKVRLLARFRRRQLRTRGLAVAAALLLVVAMVVGAAMSSHGPSRQVAAGGASRDGTVTTATAGPGVAATTGSVTVAPTVPPPVAVAPGGNRTTTVPPPDPVTTAVPTSSTAPGVTSPGATSTSTAVATAASVVQGTVLFGPVCPVERVPPDPACAPRPGAAHLTLQRADLSVAAEGDASSNGVFSIRVAPGSYTVVAVGVSSTPGVGGGCSAAPNPVVVKSGAASGVAVSCDTGIR